MELKTHESYLRFIEDSTYQRRAGITEDVPEHVKEAVRWFRDQWRARQYDKIIEASRRTPEPVGCPYESMALAAMGRFEESVTPIFRGIRRTKEKEVKSQNKKDKEFYAALRGVLYNQLAIRLYVIDKDDQAAEYYASKGWTISRDGRHVWTNITTICELKLIRVSEGRADINNTIVEIESLMDELCASFNWVQDQDFISYIYRSVGLEKWRKYKNGLYFKKRFGHVKPR